jgi:iron complex transport system ATP-binding protein
MSPDSSTYLVAHEVSYAYPRRGRGGVVPAVSGVSLAVPRGSFTGLLGPNGCGKTTLLKLMAGVLRPAIRHRLARRARARRPPSPHRGATRRGGAAGHASGVRLHGARDRADGAPPAPAPHAARRPGRSGHRATSLGATGTLHLADRPFNSLSGGERQRVVIASALAQQPDVLLLDEPTASLDLGYQLEVASLLRRLSRERDVTMVMATHDLNLAASMCDALALLRDGRLLRLRAGGGVLSRSAVRELYDVEADVQFHQAAGHLTVTPVRRAG